MTTDLIQNFHRETLVNAICQPVQQPLLPLDDEADGGETHCHEVGDAEDDTRGHELREGWLIAPIHWSLELTA